jgi:hypothetical protein
MAAPDGARVTAGPPHAASSAASDTAPSQPQTAFSGLRHEKRRVCRRPRGKPACETCLKWSFLMEYAMSDLFDEYPLLMAGLEILIPLFLVVYIVVWTKSGKKKPQDERAPRRPD